MSEHPPQHHPHPSDPAADAAPIDVVAGDPPVPITVWRTTRTSSDTGRSISARLAARLISAYSRPDEAVVDLTDHHALAAACLTGKRRHHPGWFTDSSSLIIGPATPAPPPDDADTTETPETADDLEDEDVPDMAAWFGDDLTDAYLPPPEPVADQPPDTTLQHTTSLVVASWPLHERDAANRVRLAWLLAACARLLRPGGCLILVVTVPAGSGVGPQDFTPVLQAAGGAGLGYLQHIVAVSANIDGDAFVYHITDEELLALASTTSSHFQMAHLRVHADLLVFSHTNKRPRRRGGDARG